MRDSNTSNQLETELRNTAEAFARVFKTRRKSIALAHYRELSGPKKIYIQDNLPYSSYLKSARIQF